MSDRVLVTVTDGVADVRFNRPDKRNALDGAQFAAIAEAGEHLKSEPGVRAVVLSGAGASFCAGLDFSIFGQMAGGATSAATDGGGVARDGNPGRLTESGLTHLGQQVCWVWQELPVPVIAALRGHALGGGLQIALGADIRIAHPDTQLSVRELHWGITPDMTGTFVLSKLVRPDVARELTYTARVLDAREGHALGSGHAAVRHAVRGGDGAGGGDRRPQPAGRPRRQGAVQPDVRRRASPISSSRSGSWCGR